MLKGTYTLMLGNHGQGAWVYYAEPLFVGRGHIYPGRREVSPYLPKNWCVL